MCATLRARNARMKKPILTLTFFLAMAPALAFGQIVSETSSEADTGGNSTGSSGTTTSGEASASAHTTTIVADEGGTVEITVETEADGVKETQHIKEEFPQGGTVNASANTGGEARAGVSVPKVLEVDEKENKIIMEFIEGEQAKNVASSLSAGDLQNLAYNIGISVGKLHYAGLIHGDLTTSNMILKDGKLYLIDFGLGQQSAHPEDQGTDLAVLHESIRATHLKQLEILWLKIIEGYKSVFPQADKVLKALHSIEMRGRYMRRSP